MYDDDSTAAEDVDRWDDDELKEKLDRIDRMAIVDQFSSDKLKADIEFSRKPKWMQATLEGDRLNDGSDEQEYNKEDQDVR